MKTQPEGPLFEPVQLDKPSSGIRNRWAKRILDGSAKAIPVYVGGVWTINIQRGNKRILRVSLD